MTWEKLNTQRQFDDMLNNWQAYHDITITPEQREAEEQEALEAEQQSQELWDAGIYLFVLRKEDYLRLSALRAIFSSMNKRD